MRNNLFVEKRPPEALFWVPFFNPPISPETLFPDTTGPSFTKSAPHASFNWDRVFDVALNPSLLLNESAYGALRDEPMERMEINRVLSSAVEKSIAARGTNVAAVWMDREGAPEKGVRRCEAIFRMINAQEPFRVLDVGCGPGFAIPFLEERYGPMVGRYFGIDISEPLIAEARRLWPSHRFEVHDIIENPLPRHAVEYAALNGVLTAKFSLSQEAMEKFSQQLLEHSWQAASEAISFNVMSPHVDWTRDDLFHWPLDRAVAFCVAKLSRHLNVISDYGLYEYTVQLFRSPRRSRPDSEELEVMCAINRLAQIVLVWRVTEEINVEFED